MSRLPAAVLIVTLHVQGYPWLVLAVFILAALTDALDGHLAREWECTSAFGARVDPYADKALCWAGTAVVLDQLGWPLVIVLPLVLAIGIYDLGLAILRFVYSRTHIPTNRYAKHKTIFLMTGICILYADRLLTSYTGTLLWWIGAAAIWIATHLAIRSAAAYLRGFGFSHIPTAL